LRHFAAVPDFGRERTKADMPRGPGAGRIDAIDPKRTSAPPTGHKMSAVTR